jgi:uncharacterized protein Usg
MAGLIRLHGRPLSGHSALGNEFAYQMDGFGLDVERTMVDSAFRRQIEGYGLTTARILYHLPDHPSLLQEFIWQDYDLFPHFLRFLGFYFLAKLKKRKIKQF